MKFINIGYGNMVAVDRIVTLVSPDSAPIKRLIQDAKDDGRVIDVTCGRKTRAVIITDSEHVILSALQAETIAPIPTTRRRLATPTSPRTTEPRCGFPESVRHTGTSLPVRRAVNCQRHP
mgnify:CR=1 FL=1